MLSSFFNKWIDAMKLAVANEIKTELDKWLPILVTAVVKAVIETAPKVATLTEDEITNHIPGSLDDKLFDPIFKSVMDTLQGVFK